MPFLLAAVASALLSFASPAAAADAPAERIIVKREPGLTAAERAGIRADAGVDLVRTLAVPRTEVVEAPAGEAGAALRALNADPDVTYAERDVRMGALAADPYFPDLWGLQTTDGPGAWALSTGAGQTVAVVDTGVDPTHEDLAGHVLPARNFVYRETTTDDGKGHGTHVAGTIVAVRDNGIGVAGLAPDARVLPLRALDATGTGWLSDIANAFAYAGDHGVRVVNASLGGTSDEQTLEAAITSHPDTLYVVSAGNGGSDGIGDDNDAAAQTYPCAYPAGNVLCVAATDSADTLAGFSNFGRTSVDVAAPGVGVLSTFPGNRYGFADGTSMASPHVAAIAALVLARNSGLTTAQLKAAILGSADPVASLAGKIVSGGRADALRALEAVPADPNAAPVVTPPPAPVAPAVTPAPTPAPPSRSVPAADRDRDGRPDAVDACRTEAARTIDGCPVPAVSSLRVRVSRRGGSRRTATVTVRASRPATVALTVQRRVCKRARCTWKRVSAAQAGARHGAARVRVAHARGLARGSYRVTAVLTSNAGRSAPRTVAFRVR